MNKRPTPDEWLAQLPGLKKVGGQLQGPCPECGGSDRFHVNLREPHTWNCRGCNSRTIAATVFAPGDPVAGGGRQPPANRVLCPPEGRGGKPPTQAMVGKLLAASRRIPHREADHPARRWITARNLWWPSVPTPKALRWIDAGPWWPEHQGVGALLAFVAAPAAWIAHWPDSPPFTGVQCIHVDQDGGPVLDRPGGNAKVSYGAVKGNVFLAGDPRPEKTDALNLTEGVADCLALACRFNSTSAAMLGTANYTHPEPRVLAWAKTFAPIYVNADNDPPGLAAAEAFRSQVRGALVVIIRGHKDPAAWAASDPLAPIDMEAAQGLCLALESLDKLPRWEAARLAALASTQYTEGEL